MPGTRRGRWRPVPERGARRLAGAESEREENERGSRRADERPFAAGKGDALRPSLSRPPPRLGSARLGSLLRRALPPASVPSPPREAHLASGASAFLPPSPLRSGQPRCEGSWKHLGNSHPAAGPEERFPAPSRTIPQPRSREPELVREGRHRRETLFQNSPFEVQRERLRKHPWEGKMGPMGMSLPSPAVPGQWELPAWLMLLRNVVRTQLFRPQRQRFSFFFFFPLVPYFESHHY